MSNKNGDTEQHDNVPLPWNTEFSVDIKKDSYFFAYISVQNNSMSGNVTATIFIDGEEFKSATNTGGYVIATASGSVK